MPHFPVCRPMERTFSYPQGNLDHGELLHVGPIPVLRVEGTPEQIGRQAAELAGVPAARVLDYPLDLVAARLGSRRLAQLCMPLLDRLGRRLVPRLCDRHRRELLSLAGALGDERRVMRGNTLFDLKNLQPRRLFGCSSLALGGSRTRVGGPLLARNLDFYDLGYLHEFGLVTVYRPADRGLRRFVSVGFPCSVGVFTGMNAAGLAVATHEVFGARGRGFNPRGEPFAATCRRVLEECDTVAEADALFREAPRTTPVSVAACDVRDQAVFELTPEGVTRRDACRGAVVCVNHFLATRPGLGWANPFNTVGRLEQLSRVAAADTLLGAAEAWATLAEVSQGALTIQSMVFEPARLALHVSLGAGPATRLTPTELRLGEWF